MSPTELTPPSVSGPWSAARVSRWLEETRIPLRLACTTGSGWPAIVSLWFQLEDGALWCATPASARVTSYLEGDSRCAFEVATSEIPYRGLRGQGRARIEPEEGRRVLRALIQRYLGDEDSELARWLLGRTEPEVALRIEPLRIYTWDYSERMQDL